MTSILSIEHIRYVEVHCGDRSVGRVGFNFKVSPLLVLVLRDPTGTPHQNSWFSLAGALSSFILTSHNFPIRCSSLVDESTDLSIITNKYCKVVI